LAKFFPTAQIVAVDISEEALNVARRNAKTLSLDKQIRFLRSDLYAELSPEKEGLFDMIVSNPPYVTHSEYESLMADVKKHEPRTALVGGADGLDIIRPLIRGAKPFLKRGGRLLLEIGYRQADVLREELSANGFSDIHIRKDFAGHDRLVAARWDK